MIALPDGIKIVEFTPEKLTDIWKNLKQFDSTILERDLKDRITFVEAMLPPHIVMETDHGIILFEDVNIGLRARMHVSFWDKKLSERADLVKQCLQWIFLSLDLYRIDVWVPAYARAFSRFLTSKLGFNFEGTLRNYFKRNDVLIDTNIYALQREEIL
jgi:hypothetical protein